VKQSLIHRDAGKGGFDGKCAPVGPVSLEDADRLAGRRADPGSLQLKMLEGFRQPGELAHRPPLDLRPRAAEHGLGSRIDEHNSEPIVRADNRVGDRVDDGLEP